MSFLKLWQLIQAIVSFVRVYGTAARPIIEAELNALLAAGTITQAQHDQIEALLNLLLGTSATGFATFASTAKPTVAEFKALAGL